MITLAQPRITRFPDHRQHLLTGQVAEHRTLETLDRNSQGALDHLERCYVPVTGELEKRPQRRQTGIATAYRIVPLPLKMIEEGHDQFRRNVSQRHCRWRHAQSFLSKCKEQHEPVAIGGNGLRTERALLGQVLAEIGLHQGRKRRW